MNKKLILLFLSLSFISFADEYSDEYFDQGFYKIVSMKLNAIDTKNKTLTLNNIEYRYMLYGTELYYNERVYEFLPLDRIPLRSDYFVKLKYQNKNEMEKNSLNAVVTYIGQVETPY